MGNVRVQGKCPIGGLVNSIATCDFTETIGPLTNVCFAVRKTDSSSVAGLNVTVPSMLWVVEAFNVIGAPLVLTVVMLVLFATGTAAMTAVARPSAVITTS